MSAERLIPKQPDHLARIKLAKEKIKTKGKVFTMLYNPPFIPGFLRRNEVAIEVE